MLALLGIGANLYEDAGGVPGALLSGDTVSVGETFFVEITAEDLRDTPQGVNGLSLDLTWDAQALEVINDPFEPADRDSPLVTPAFSGFRGGTLDETNSAAMIDDLQGLGPSQSGIGAVGPERYSLIHFRADAPSQQPLEIALGNVGAGLVNYLRNLLPDDLQIERPVITVTSGESGEHPLPRVSVHDASVLEGDAGITEVAVTVELSGEAAGPVSVRVASRDDQARAEDADFQPLTDQVLTFAPGGSNRQTVIVEIRGDEQFENDERFFVQLSDAVGATLLDAQAEIVILNDDSPVEPTDPQPGNGSQNTDDPFDVNADGFRSPLDVLLIINELSTKGPHLLPSPAPADSLWRLDVNGDGGVSRLDALLIFNFLRFGPQAQDPSPPDGSQGAGGEGESSGVPVGSLPPRPPRIEPVESFEFPELPDGPPREVVPEAVDVVFGAGTIFGG